MTGFIFVFSNPEALIVWDYLGRPSHETPQSLWLRDQGITDFRVETAFVEDPSSPYMIPQMVVRYTLENPNDAMLFKLTWGGQ